MGSRPSLPETWNIPETEEVIDQLFDSSEKPVVIYKHSYNCPTCIFTKSKAETIMDEYADRAGFWFVDVIANRAISNLIAEKSGVRHQSPQALVLHNGSVYWHASHGAITEEAIQSALDEVTPSATE